MTTIDKIMAQAQRYAEAVVRDTDWASDQDDTDACNAALTDLRTLITQAIAEARADGAREMRARILSNLGVHYGDATGMHMAVVRELCAIDAPPPPAKREPVRLTESQIRAIDHDTDDMEVATDGAMEFARAIETAVLAANGLTK